VTVLAVGAREETNNILEKLYFVKQKYKIDQLYLLCSDGDEVGTPSCVQEVAATASSSAQIVKRLAAIQKAAAATCFGILVLNPNTEYCRASMRLLKQVIKQNREKKCFTFCMSN
jgi:hypothetical protein